MGTEAYERHSTTAKRKGNIPTSNISAQLHTIVMNFNILLSLYSSLQQHQCDLCTHQESRIAKQRTSGSELTVIRTAGTARLGRWNTSPLSLLSEVWALTKLITECSLKDVQIQYVNNTEHAIGMWSITNILKHVLVWKTSGFTWQGLGSAGQQRLPLSRAQCCPMSDQSHEQHWREQVKERKKVLCNSS